MKIQPGDLILYRTTKHSPIHDKLIVLGEWALQKKISNQKYCHVALVSNDVNLILEAVWPKTHVTKLDWNQSTKIEVYRLKNITKDQIQKAIYWAEDHLGEWYDLLEFLGGWIDIKHAEICSTYVTKAFQAAGIDFKTSHNGFITPDEIAISNLVTRVK